MIIAAVFRHVRVVDLVHLKLLNWDPLAPVTIFTEKYYEETKYLC